MSLARSRFLALAALVTAASTATACEPALLRLILSRDVQGEFEASMRALSGTLLEAGRAARAEDVPALRDHTGRFLDGWLTQYKKVYLAPPRGHQDDRLWRARCDALTTRTMGLKPGRLPEDLASVHPVLQDLQDLLAAFYLPAPGSVSPPKEFEIARALAADLDVALVAEGTDRDTAERRLQRFVQRLAATAEDSPGWAEFLVSRDEIRAALSRGDTPPKLAPAVERLRTATLAKLWFSGGTP